MRTLEGTESMRNEIRNGFTVMKESWIAMRSAAVEGTLA